MNNEKTKTIIKTPPICHPSPSFREIISIAVELARKEPVIIGVGAVCIGYLISRIKF